MDVRTQHPAAVRIGNDRGQQLDGAIRLLVADLVGGIPHAGVGKALQDATMAELVEFGRHFVGADLRRRRHEIEAPGAVLRRRAGTSASGSCRRCCIWRGRRSRPPGPWGSIFLSVGVRASAISALRSWMARVTRSRICRSALSNCPYRTTGRATKMPIRATSFRVSDAARRRSARRQPSRRRPRSFPSGSRRTGSYRSRRRWGRRLGTCF